MDKTHLSNIIKMLEEAYNTNTFDVMGDLLANNAQLLTSNHTKYMNRKEIVRYYQTLAQEHWERGWLDIAQTAIDENGDDILVILENDLVSIREILRIVLDLQGTIQTIEVTKAHSEKIILDREGLLDAEGLYRRALYPIMKKYERNGFRVSWMSSDAAADISICLSKEKSMTYLKLCVGMWPLGGPRPSQETIENLSEKAQQAGNEHRWISVSMSNDTDREERRWFRGDHDGLGMEYEIEWLVPVELFLSRKRRVGNATLWN
jgi:hypothetical protein